MGIIIATKSFGLLWDTVNKLKPTPKEPQNISDVLEEINLNYGVFKVIQKTVGDYVLVEALLMFDNILNVDLKYVINPENQKVKLIKDSWWIGDSERAIQGLTPDNWIEKFKDSGYWSYLEKSEEGTKVLNKVNKFFQTDYNRLPEIILNTTNL